VMRNMIEKTRVHLTTGWAIRLVIGMYSSKRVIRELAYISIIPKVMDYRQKRTSLPDSPLYLIMVQMDNLVTFFNTRSPERAYECNSNPNTSKSTTVGARFGYKP
jgi:hypothetical protein